MANRKKSGYIRSNKRRKKHRISLDAITRIGLLITLVLVLILCIVLITKCGNDEPERVTAPIPTTTKTSADGTTDSTTDGTTHENNTTGDDETTGDNETEETTSDTSSTSGDSIFDDGEFIVCVDPGHGGVDGGTTGINGNEDRLEKNDVLNLSLLIRDELEALGVTVIMTRDTDTDLKLADRPAIANEANADVLISIHRNSYASDTSVKGFEAWISSQAPTNSMNLANKILSGLEAAGISRNRGVRTGTQGNAAEDYAVNSQSQMPSCLLELGFMSSPEDNNLYDTKMSAYAKSIAQSVYDWLIAQ